MAEQKLYVSIVGSRQGRFNGESSGKTWKSPILSATLGDGIVSPRDTATGQASGKRQHQPLSFLTDLQAFRDLATGQASGKRQHKPIVITKNWGAASPQLFQALVSNEVLRVVIEFVDGDPDRTGTARIVKLSGARIVGIRNKGVPVKHGTSANPHELEEVSFTFQKIEVSHRSGKSSCSDNWAAAG
jgi:type VI secretion system secreted protein Hcp